MACTLVLVYMLNSKKDMYSNSVFFFFDLSWGFMSTYSILDGYVHKYGSGCDLGWKAHSRGFPNMHGGFLGNLQILLS